MIKRILVSAACLIVLMTPALAQEPTLLTPEEIWQDGASWMQLWDSGPRVIYDYWHIDGTTVYEGQTYMKVFLRDSDGNSDFWFGVRVDGSKLSVFLETQAANGRKTGKFIAFPFCDFDGLQVGQEFSHKCAGFKPNGDPYIKDFDYPVLESKTVLPCPDIPGKSLEIYSSDEMLSSWDPMKSRLVVSGLGGVSTIDGLLWPYYGGLPCYRVTISTLYFKDGQGREIFRHPFYDRIMGIVSGVDDVMTESEPVCNVYSISGSPVLTDVTQEQMDCLPRGIYIKRQGNKTEKILVK